MCAYQILVAVRGGAGRRVCRERSIIRCFFLRLEFWGTLHYGSELLCPSPPLVDVGLRFTTDYKLFIFIIIIRYIGIGSKYTFYT